MQITWESQKGSDRRRNHDSAAFCNTPSYMAAIIVDAAEKGEDGQHFSVHWATSVMHALLTHIHHVVPPPLITNLLRELHASLREQFLKEIASYCFVLIDTESRHGYSLSVGDCMVGFEYENEINWINTPHRLSQLMPDNVSAVSHILTRSLKVRRFSTPEVNHFQWNEKQVLVMSTDGYWDEFINHSLSTTDDMSTLRVERKVSSDTLRIRSDTDNFFLFDDKNIT